MRSTVKVLTTALFSAILAGSAMAATTPATAPRTPAAAPAAHATASAQPDCQKLGSDVSVLIDQRKDAPNIATARAMFQVGIMECMEGSDDSANKHYADVKKMLADNVPPE